MNVSLTSAGLYLEPRVYKKDSSGANYGTPFFVAGTVEFSGTWTGLDAGYGMGNSSIVENVTNHTTLGGGSFSESPNSISRLVKEVA